MFNLSKTVPDFENLLRHNSENIRLVEALINNSAGSSSIGELRRYENILAQLNSYQVEFGIKLKVIGQGLQDGNQEAEDDETELVEWRVQ